MHTIVRKANAVIWVSLKAQVKCETVDGSSGGWRNDCSESGCSQYSSSHSIGKSASMLHKLLVVPNRPMNHPHSSIWMPQVRPKPELVGFIDLEYVIKIKEQCSPDEPIHCNQRPIPCSIYIATIEYIRWLTRMLASSTRHWWLALNYILFYDAALDLGTTLAPSVSKIIRKGFATKKNWDKELTPTRTHDAWEVEDPEDRKIEFKMEPTNSQWKE